MVTVSPSGNTTAAVTYTPIATNTLSSAASSVTFSSIPGTYTDLVWIIEGISTANTVITVQFNNDTSANYSCTWINGNGTSAVSSRDTTSYIYIGNPTNRFNIIGSILNYSNSSTYKSWLSRSNTVASQVAAVVGLWRSTSAITSIKFLNSNFDTGTTFTLYGIGA